MPLKQDLALAWRILGSTRIYVAIAGIVVLILAVIGLWHLILPASQPQSLAQSSTTNTATPQRIATSPAAQPATARISPAAMISPSVAGVPSATPSASPPERAVAITDVRQERRTGPRGETLVIATIGLASRQNLEKDALEIRISFFDLTPSNEMRPTNAQVTYRWLTPVRDWSDPASKFLTATYFKPRPPPWLRERLHYGGFVVRVYSDGRLQDERSQPESLLSQLRANAAPPQAPGPETAAAAATSTPATAAASPPPNSSPQFHPSSLRPHPSASPAAGGPNLPYGIPIPGKPGFVQSPYDPKFIIDVRGFPPGTLVNDPNTSKAFRVP